VASKKRSNAKLQRQSKAEQSRAKQSKAKKLATFYSSTRVAQEHQNTLTGKARYEDKGGKVW